MCGACFGAWREEACIEQGSMGTEEFCAKSAEKTREWVESKRAGPSASPQEPVVSRQKHPRKSNEPSMRGAK